MANEAGSSRGAAERLGAFRRAFPGTRTPRQVFAPGRVNLIGEHIDYSDLPVLPMAIQRGVSIVYSPRDDASVRVANEDARFEPRAFELSPAIPPAGRGDWSNYPRAAGQALAQRFGTLRGFDGVVSSDLPASAGLSSSSALTVATALALLDANALSCERLELAQLCARGEHYVGTQSGAMDQTICLLGRPDHALKIDFAPLRSEPLPIPADWRFVIANTHVRAEKSGAAQEHYNARRSECRDALRTLASHPGLQETPHSYPELLGHHGVDTLLAWAEERLEQQLQRRFRHVLREAARVESARNALLSRDAAAFGRLMSASHASLRDDYEVSCPELDDLVAIARSSDALGARLTGAGFGGCVVALCREPSVPTLVEGFERTFYSRRPAADATTPNVIVARASQGAQVGALE
jgi:galactokinase